MRADYRKSEPTNRRLPRSPAFDDRGRDVWPLLHQSLRQMKWDPKHRTEYRRLVFGSEAQMWNFAGVWIVLIGGVSTVFVIPGFRAALRAMQGGSSLGSGLKAIALFELPVFACALCTALAVNWWNLRRIAGKRIVPGLLAQHRCGSCMYGLERAPMESDGCTVCPECGSAWRLP